MDLVERVLAGERLALARLLTQVEDDTPVGREALERLFSRTGSAHLVGITGAPGTGKSSMVNRLALALRAETGGRVAVLAVDPTSPFSGGALLGDRLRMKDAAADADIFIRSMASRGALGGLARTTAAAAQVLDAAGYAWVLIETVGAGQSEVDVARLAHTVIVVDAPGLGDDIQAIKAGLMEIADILVVNKADLEGAENTLRALRGMLEITYSDGQALPALEGDRWRPPLLKSVSTTGEGLPEIVCAVCDHGVFLRESGGWKRREEERLQREFELLARERLWQRWKERVGGKKLKKISEQIAQRQISPFQAVIDWVDPSEPDDYLTEP
jgi:LAO/AO transport system kinase